MPCVPVPRVPQTTRADAFTFSAAPDSLSRTVANTTMLMSAPWMAFWAIALEAMNPENYRM